MAKRIMIAGAIASHPLGGAGNAWAFLQYVLGFRELGFETYYVEHIDAARCIDDDWKAVPFAQSANVRFFRQVMEQFDLMERCSLLEWDGPGSIGLPRGEIERLARGTVLLINGSGRFHLASVLGAVQRRLYLDLDPGFAQIW